jgi:hypothetical protein
MYLSPEIWHRFVQITTEQERLAFNQWSGQLYTLASDLNNKVSCHQAWAKRNPPLKHASTWSVQLREMVAGISLIGESWFEGEPQSKGERQS